jgi:pimeloyl-ACP methyl ester carboxylesterase
MGAASDRPTPACVKAGLKPARLRAASSECGYRSSFIATVRPAFADSRVSAEGEERREMTERTVAANGVELCTEPFGDPADPPILLIMGIGASMLWWEEGFCQLLADGGRFVIRYDHRDTGRSVTYALGRPGYSGADLVGDATGVLDAYQISAAHLVGVSAGGAFAQRVALDHPDRVCSLVLISTSPALPRKRELPPPTDEFGRFVSTAAVDWSDAESVIDYLVGYSRVLAGRRVFDEAQTRSLVRRDIARARDFAAVQNHDVLPEARPRAGRCRRSPRRP